MMTCLCMRMEMVMKHEKCKGVKHKNKNAKGRYEQHNMVFKNTCANVT